MENNWEGHEAIRQMCSTHPSTGNGIEWVDHIGYEIETVILDFLNKHPKPHNECFLLRQIPVTFYVPLGKVTWATPNGRRATEYSARAFAFPRYGYQGTNCVAEFNVPSKEQKLPGKRRRPH